MIDLMQAMRLYLITDDSARSPDELAGRVARALDGGVTAVQFREKNSGAAMAARAFERVSQVCEQAGVPLFLNADLTGKFDVTAPLAGYHYSDRTLPLHPGELSVLCGYSAHSADDAASAFAHGAHFCTLSPIYPTPSKIGILDAIGESAIRECRERLPDRPVVALGGVNFENTARCMAAGATGVAVIRAVMAAECPERAARSLRRLVENCLDA